MKLKDIWDHMIEALFHEDRIRTRNLAYEYSRREEMDAEYDQQGRRWNSHGHEVK